MTRMMGLIVILAMTWIAAEIYTKGPEGAFAFLKGGDAAKTAEHVSTPKRVGDKVQGLMRDGADRYAEHEP